MMSGSFARRGHSRRVLLRFHSFVFSFAGLIALEPGSKIQIFIMIQELHIRAVGLAECPPARPANRTNILWPKHTRSTAQRHRRPKTLGGIAGLGTDAANRDSSDRITRRAFLRRSSAFPWHLHDDGFFMAKILWPRAMNAWFQRASRCDPANLLEIHFRQLRKVNPTEMFKQTERWR